MTIEQLDAYELIEKREIGELNSTGYYLKQADLCLGLFVL